MVFIGQLMGERTGGGEVIIANTGYIPELSVNVALSVIASDRRGAKQSPDFKRDCFVADTFASLSAWFILSLSKDSSQ